MKSLVVTVVVLSSLSVRSYAAEQTDERAKRDGHQAPAVSRDQVPKAGPYHPNLRLQPKDGASKGAPAAPATPQKQEAPLPSKGDHSSTTTTPASTVKFEQPIEQGLMAHTAVPTKTAAPARTPPTAPTAASAKPAIAAIPAPATPAKLTPKTSAPAQAPAPIARPTVFQAVKPQVPPRAATPRPPMVPASRPFAPSIVIQQHPEVRVFAERRAADYRAAYHDRLLFLQNRYIAPTYFAPLRIAYRPWVRVGFYAYAYPVRPVVEFYTYFTNPCVAWFYTEYDEQFYQPFYAQYVVRYPDLARGYEHVGLYLPTQEFLDLNVAISEMAIEQQVHYRRAMRFLAERLSERYRTPINRHQVIVNHYKMLPNGRAVVIEGFVDNEQVQMPFKALVDLHNADASMLFAVNSWSADAEVSALDSEDLYDLNDQMIDYGGELDVPPPPPPAGS